MMKRKHYMHTPLSAALRKKSIKQNIREWENKCDTFSTNQHPIGQTRMEANTNSANKCSGGKYLPRTVPTPKAFLSHFRILSCPFLGEGKFLTGAQNDTNTTAQQYDNRRINISAYLIPAAQTALYGLRLVDVFRSTNYVLVTLRVFSTKSTLTCDEIDLVS